MDEEVPYGRRLLTSVLEQRAQETPTETFCLYPHDDDPRKGFPRITWEQTKNAVDAMVTFVKRQFRNCTPNETVAYIGPADARHVFVFHALMKLRLKLFLPSPRNPISVNKSLMQQTDCSKLIHADEASTIAEELGRLSPELQCAVAPALDELLHAACDKIPYEFDFESVKLDPILIIHSSGTTGPPKPITMTHGTFATSDNDHNRNPSVLGRKNADFAIWESDEPRLVYDAFPPFHLAGFFRKVVCSTFTNSIPVYGPAYSPPSGRGILDILRSLDVRVCALPPTYIEQIYHEPGGSAQLQKLDLLVYAGGPLSDTVGDDIVQHVPILPSYGSTEMGQIRLIMPNPEDWAWFEFDPSNKQTMQEAADGVYELVILPNQESDETSSLRHNLPETRSMREWHSKDLFRPHPTKPGLWKFHCRTDDIIILSTGAKLNPIPMEQALTALPGVAGVIMVGGGRPRAGLLIELDTNHDFGGNAVDTLWPHVQETNNLLRSDCQVTKEMILTAKSTKPFVRAAKGTVMRRLTNSLYEEELNQLFKDSLPLDCGPFIDSTRATA